MGFIVGKTYRHTTGKRMTIIGVLNTHTYGSCLVGETDDGELTPVGTEEENALGWRVEMTDEELIYNLRSLRRLDVIRDSEKETIDILTKRLCNHDL